MKIISICLARKGSKRLINKNMKLFCGKPLIHYTADLMKKLNFESWIFTDYQELSNYIKDNFHNINIGKKPFIYAQDIHKTNEELKYYNKKINVDIFIYLAATSPIRDIENIKKHIDIFLNNLDKYDCAMGVRKLPDRFYWRVFQNRIIYQGKEGDNFFLNNRKFNNENSYKWDIFEETGSIYIFKKELLDSNFFINEKCLFIQENFCYDIDTIEDWQKAENYYKELNNAKK